MDPTVQFDDMHNSPSPAGNEYFELNNELDLTPTSGSGGKRPADDGSDIGSYGNIIAPEDKDDAPRIKRPKSVRPIMQNARKIGHSKVINQGDKPKPTTAESEPEPEDDPVFDIMYKMVMAKKNITCKWKSSLTFDDFRKNSVELSGLKETGRWRLELGWKFTSATKAETYDALDDEEDYERMISLMCENFKQRKRNSRTNAREILLEVLNKDEQLSLKSRSKEKGKGKGKGKGKKKNDSGSDNSTSEDSDLDSSDSSMAPSLAKKLKGKGLERFKGVTIPVIVEQLRMHLGKQCQQHPGLPCRVLAGNDQVGQHALYSHDDMKKWAQCLKMGLATFDEPPVSISEVAEQQRNMPPPLGRQSGVPPPMTFNVHMPPLPPVMPNPPTSPWYPPVQDPFMEMIIDKSYAVPKKGRNQHVQFASSDGPEPPPSSIFPCIPEWLSNLENDTCQCPDKLNLTRFGDLLLAKGFTRLDHLIGKCGDDKDSYLIKLGIGMGEGEADLIFKWGKHDVREIHKKWESGNEHTS
ncbi:hypothetical protein BS47DRAFT_1382501 [Hydnum rufescens UP504]|uniref:Uncharacterized protein n=1 Tax=Hydnum rufescens UP504 TaxID=1448309 RepID=A0A9P6AXY0_9AGAM|nr:hypothetical protein BS47DRAFT_1382501 [Hydnum rufescens UP504]